MTKFNLEDEIEDLNIAEMLKTGLKSYIQKNEIIIKSKKDFEKVVDTFLKIKIGG